MQLHLLDPIVDFQPCESITATKSSTLAEEYLQDHFPRFPVMPGILTLECLDQAGMWLVSDAVQDRYSTVLLKEVKNVKYADFVQPEQTRTVRAEMLKREGDLTTLNGLETLNERTAVSDRIVLEGVNIVVEHPGRGAWDEYARKEMGAAFQSADGAADSLVML